MVAESTANEALAARTLPPSLGSAEPESTSGTALSGHKYMGIAPYEETLGVVTRTICRRSVRFRNVTDSRATYRSVGQ
jgi:hypothetical protein